MNTMPQCCNCEAFAKDVRHLIRISKKYKAFLCDQCLSEVVAKVAIAERCLDKVKLVRVK
jgi:hypothetical protein